MNIFKNLLEIFHPETWVMIRPYSSDVEKIFNNIINDFNVEIESYYKVKETKSYIIVNIYDIHINGNNIWIANYPYGCSIYKLGLRPRRRTMRRFYKKLDEYYKSIGIIWNKRDNTLLITKELKCKTS